MTTTTAPFWEPATEERPCYGCTPSAERQTPDGTRPLPLCPHHGSVVDVGAATRDLRHLQADPPCGAFLIGHADGHPRNLFRPVLDPTTLRVCVRDHRYADTLLPFAATEHTDQHGADWSSADDTEED